MSCPCRISVSTKLTVAALLALVAVAAPALSAAAAKPPKPHLAAFTTTAPSADLATAIATLPTAQTTGYQYFAVTVTNNGPDPASNVVITGGTPPRSTFYCVTGVGAACGSASGVMCTAPTALHRSHAPSRRRSTTGPR